MFWRTIPNQQSRLILLAVLTSILIPTRGAAQAPLVPVLSFTSQTAQVQGVTPGGTVIWFAAVRDVDEYTVAQTSVAEAAVADQTGMSTLTLTSPISPNSIWV